MVRISLQRFITTVLILAVLYSLGACQGCSNSGRKSLRNREGSKPRSERNDRTIESKPNQVSPSRITKQPEAVAPGNSLLSELYKTSSPAVLFIETYSDTQGGKQGSGFVISSTGVCVSNYHVFKGNSPGREKVYLDGRVFKVSKVYHVSEQSDFIVFQLNSNTPLPFVPVARNKPSIGEEVFAIGNPKGLEKTLSTGIVSQHRVESGLIQTTAEITHGSSGGPLFNMNGEVVGITTSGFDEANLNFAVDIQLLPYKKYQKKKAIAGNFLGLLPNSICGQVIHHNYYSLSYCENHEQAEWVAYMLKQEYLDGPFSRTDDFREDPYVSTGSAELEDYRYSGYDRGHLLPAACMKHDKVAMSETFFLSNVSPQVREFNGGLWHELEKQVRKWVLRSDSTFVVTGSVLSSNLGTIGRNKVTIPRYHFKVIVRFISGEMVGIGFLMENRPQNGDVMQFAVTIDEIEKKTGIDFFAQLPQRVQVNLESRMKTSKWQ